MKEEIQDWLDEHNSPLQNEALQNEKLLKEMKNQLIVDQSLELLFDEKTAHKISSKVMDEIRTEEGKSVVQNSLKMIKWQQEVKLAKKKQSRRFHQSS